MKLYELTELSPREAMDVYIGPDIPVRGGWGYSAEDACIIDKNDAIIDPDDPMPFYGVGFEKIFVERRIYMELITFRPEAERHSGIKWKMLRQSLAHHEGKPHDHLEYQVTAHEDKDWNALKEEWEGPEGFVHPDFDQEEHLKRRKASMKTFEMEFWFEISSFYGQFPGLMGLSQPQASS
jgi:hypothetical protein